MGRKQSSLKNLKTENRMKIVDLLKSAKLSASDIAKILGLSIAGTASLIDEMVTEGILVKQAATSVSRGRRPLFIEINAACGVVAVVDLTEMPRGKYEVYLCDMCGGILDSRAAEVEGDYLATMISFLHEMQSNFGRKLYSIAVIAMGKIDKDTGAFHFSPDILDYKAVNYKTIFEKEFNVPTIVKNLLVYMLAAEKFYNCDLKIDNGIYVFDLGCSLCIDGKIYEGSKGYVGELGLISMNAYEEITEFSCQNPYHNNLFFVTKTGIVDMVKKELGSELLFGKRADQIDIDDIARGYRERISCVIPVVDWYLKIFSAVLKNIVEFLDLRVIVLDGFLRELSDDVPHRIQENINRNALDKLDICVRNATQENAAVKGAALYALDAAFAILV